MDADDSDDGFLRKRPQQSRSRALVDAVLEALDELLRRGEADARDISVQRVAERAGVGIGSLYDYFANRDSLLGAFLARVTRDNFVELERKLSALSDQALEAKVDAMTAAVLRTYFDAPQRTRVLVVGVFRLGYVEPVLRERDRFAALIARHVQAVAPRSPPERVALTCEVLCDAVMGIVGSNLWRRPDDRERALIHRELTALSLAYLRATLDLPPAR